MHKHDLLAGDKSHVGLARQVAAMKAVAIAERVKQTPHCHFGFEQLIQIGEKGYPAMAIIRRRTKEDDTSFRMLADDDQRLKRSHAHEIGAVEVPGQRRRPKACCATRSLCHQRCAVG